MSNLPFPPELRTVSIVPRWSIVWTLNKDYVSNHSFFVAMYAVSIARLLSWLGPLDALMYRALTHDLDETITGDIVSPIKKEIIDHDRASTYILGMMQQRLEYIINTINNRFFHGDRMDAEISAIVKAADRLDALLFLVVEQRLGNTVIGPRIPDAQKLLKEAWDRLPGLLHIKRSAWEYAVLPSIEAHKAEGGFGV